MLVKYEELCYNDLEVRILKNITLSDPLNLKAFLQLLGEKQRDANVALKATTLQGCLDALFYSICKSDSKRNSDSDNITISSDISIRDLQKLLGGGLPLSKFESFTKDINDGRYDNVLKKNISLLLSKMSDEIQSTLFSEIVSKLSPRFFSIEEMTFAKKSYLEKNFGEILLLCLRHGFATLYNIPFFYAERLAQEASTYDYDSPIRFALLREAGRSGNRNAAFEYANYIGKSKQQYDEAWEWLLKAIPLHEALWNIAFFMEKGFVTDEKIIKDIKVLRIEEKKKAVCNCPAFSFVDGKLNKGQPEEYRLRTALVIYAFMGHKLQFFKAYNSVANVLGKISCGVEHEQEKKSLIDYYYKLSVSGCCIVALSNQGADLLKTVDERSATEDKAYKEQLIHEDVYLAYSMGVTRAKLSYAEEYELIAEREGAIAKKAGTIYQLYLDAHNALNTLTGRDKLVQNLIIEEKGQELYFKLGIYASDLKDKRKWFEYAMELQVPDAVYFWAKAIFDDCRGDRTAILELAHARDILNERCNQLQEKKKDAGMLLYTINGILERAHQELEAASTLSPW